MKLDDAQRQKVSQWIEEGLTLSKIQDKLASEFGLRMHLKRKFDDQRAGRARRLMSSANNCRRPSEVDSIRAMPDALSAAKKTPQVRRPREPGPRKPPRPPQSNPRIPPQTIEPRLPKVRTQ